MNKVQKFLEIADIPSSRKDIEKSENIRWLIGNLGIRNAKIDGFSEVFEEIKCLYKERY